MPPYLMVETYVPCPDDALAGLLAKYAGLLRQLGHPRDVETWLAGIDWPPHGEDLGATLHPEAPLSRVLVNGQPLAVLPIVNLWTPDSVPGLQRQWLSLELAFDTESDAQFLGTTNCFDPGWDTKHHYLPGVGSALWQVARAFREAMGDFPVRVCDEMVEGDAWEGLETGRGSLWVFEVALVPQRYANRFSNPPPEFDVAVLPDGLAIAERARWIVTPWEEPVSA
jgi:hypothetical protein